MRMLVISDYLDTQAVRPEAELMMRLAGEGVRIDIITFAGSAYESAFKEAGIGLYFNHPRKKLDWRFIRFLRNLCVKNDYQFFYLFNSKAIINGILAAAKLSVKVILYRGYTGNIHWYDPSAYVKYLHPRVDKIVCLAQSIKDYLDEQPFFNAEKTITINKGHDPAWYSNITPADLGEFAIGKGKFVLACMANARKFKGIKYLLQATRQWEEFSDLYLLLIGRDMAKGHLHKLIEESPIRDRIVTTGWRDDVLSILASVDVFVLPSITGEATTKSLIEAMSMGCAPIITNIPGNQDLVIADHNGLVVPTRDPQVITDAVRKYYHDPALVRQFGKKSKLHIAEHFHIQRTVKETLQLLQQLTPY